MDLSHREDLANRIRSQLDILASTFSSSEIDRKAAKDALSVLSDLAENDDVGTMVVGGGALPLLVKHLQAPLPGDIIPIPYQHKVEKASAYVLELLARKSEHHNLIANSGALPHLVQLLNRHRDGVNSNGVVRRAAGAINNLAHDNSFVKISFRIEGGIPPLIELLGSSESKVQLAAAVALRTLALNDEGNKKQIVECNGLRLLVLMLHSVDADLHYEAVGLIGNLVHSSPNIKQEVLAAGALQPIIRLLSSSCSRNQREAALLIGLFAAAEDSKIRIVQRGAVLPLILMLESPDIDCQEISAFALWRLADDTPDNQAGIVHGGGVPSLLKLMDSVNENVQKNSVFVLYELSNNEDNVVELVSFGLVEKLLDCEFITQPTRDCVAKMLPRLEEKIHGLVLDHSLYMMRVGNIDIQRRVVLALAHLCSRNDQKYVFIDKDGLLLLLGFMESSIPKHQRDGAMASCRLAKKASSLSSEEAAPLSPTVLGQQYTNDPTLSDVTFSVEGQLFHAQRACLVSSSEAFGAMFGGSYQENDGNVIEVPNIRSDVFELMMSYIHTRSVEIGSDNAEDLLRAADQYLLEGLKRMCECTIRQDISVENVLALLDLADDCNATALKQACTSFILKNSNELYNMPWYSQLIKRITPEIQSYFQRVL